ncbi:MAG: hypothetical protein DWQ01_15465 [Planctomycetota bacterium]|nr:MAG: hypothetical protein DWQ01_15465 [Planctomycetota bacterium]
MFHPRAWLAFQPVDERLQTQAMTGSHELSELLDARFWALLIFNDGPALHDLVLEYFPSKRSLQIHRHEIARLESGQHAFHFIGGPGAEPPKGTYRLWARSEQGIPLYLETHFAGFQNTLKLPPSLAEMPVLPMAPAAAWPYEEYRRILVESTILGGSSETVPAAQTFLQRVERLQRAQEEIPSHSASKEIIWTALQEVFGASEQDLNGGELQVLLDQAAAGLREQAIRRAETQESQDQVPEGALSLALVPSDPPTLYLLNNSDDRLRRVQVHIERYRWSKENGGSTELLAPMTLEYESIEARSSVALWPLEDLDHGCFLEVEIVAFRNQSQGMVQAKGMVPGALANQLEEAFPVILLQGRKAQVRTMTQGRPQEVSVDPPTCLGDGPGSLAA